ncbi:MAG: glycosyltransferase family 39 protein, partial [Chloroflexota bacterium]
MALSVALRWPFFDTVLTVDESAVAYVAYWWQLGHVLYDTIWVDRPQGIFIAYAAGMKLLGDSPEAIRLFGALYGSLTNIFVYLIAARIFGPRLGLAAALVHALLSTHPRIEGFNPNTELYMVLPSTVSAYLVLRSFPPDRPHRSGLRQTLLLVATGAAAAAAAMMKQSGVMALLFAAICVTYAHWPATSWGAARRALFGWTALATGFSLVFVPSLIHGLLTAPVDYLDAVFHFRWVGASLWAYPIGYQALQFFLSFIVVLPALAVFFAGAAWGAILGSRNRFLWTWLMISLAGVSISGDYFAHYYIHAAPPLAILFADGIRRLWERRRLAPFPLVTKLMAGLAGLSLGYMLFTYLPSSPEERLWRASPEPRYLLSR